jgi:hypothetical protein
MVILFNKNVTPDLTLVKQDIISNYKQNGVKKNWRSFPA